MIKFAALYQSDTLGQEEYQYLFGIASHSRKERAKRFIHRQDACRTLLAEALLRYCFEKFVEININEDMFLQNEFGKPEIVNSSAHFNISHSGEWVICGISEYEIGVDIEKHHTIDLNIADRFFTQLEIDLLKNCNFDYKNKTFFNIWVLKESYIKAIGKGLYCPLDSFACLPLSDGNFVDFIKYDDALPEKKFKLLNLSKQYSCAVCANEVMNIELKILEPKELIQALVK